MRERGWEVMRPTTTRTSVELFDDLVAAIADDPVLHGVSRASVGSVVLRWT